MSNPKYVQIDDSKFATPPLPPYEEPSAGPVPSMGYKSPPSMPPKYETCRSPLGAETHQVPVLQLPQTIIMRQGQPSHEPDHLAYSIFTMLCCCLPLGIAALVYSTQTQDANRAGNIIAARRNSRLALILSHAALGVGLSFLILYIIFFVTNQTGSKTEYNP
ncbi:Synapse differentiation-inducing gene protein 1-like [Varanus komodoensis]|nr:Synapse differentiation-inducing gene protein 1-like [Varanus komodoensis]